MSTEIPRTLKVLWGAGSGTRRPGLSLDRIVAAAIAIADRDGLAALSMARLAQELGSAPMSLYRHVANKDELLVFMQDAAPGPPPELPGGWRAGLTAWAWALRGIYTTHPWILQVAPGRPPLEPGQLAWLDRALGALGGTRLTAAQRLDAVMTILHFVRGEASVAAILLGGEAEAMTGYGEMISRFVTAERFPALAEAVTAGVFHPEPAAGDSARTFEAGLDTLLDGLQLSIEC
ncbi:TetR/AcrR family transcriptional regulator [Paractinoplanes rishiriensis]|uniref:TetR family transcriptional regulator n=1 Tax=Paractinoplanes rishiriensis TaxID=1050105 RepID=A0A919JZY2_9ACTN|nr:TetR/AcrR family transcriptional regulator C-terminal domain-containing protein [Actinoplanes rishiriensis]GIE96839.1 TetR family transcriptional regulator [Actinoplanes rishiriensis]